MSIESHGVFDIPVPTRIGRAVTVLTVVSTLLISVSVTAAENADAKLQGWLKRYPEADANGDGVLTMPEARAFRTKLQAARPHAGTGEEDSQSGTAEPTHANVPYGSHERNVLDFWQAESESPTPVVICFHGGGFVGGDKSNFAGTGAGYVAEGISMVSANYRLAKGPNAAPFPAAMLDGARVVQFVRQKAQKWNIDSERVALQGGSAGACMSIWIALHDDLAEPESTDPVARESTRVSCVVSSGGQTFLDPDMIVQHIGGNPDVHPSLLPFFGAPTRAALSESPFRELVQEACALNYATGDDPPLLLLYGGALDDTPLPEDASIGRSIHHAMFGKVLKDKLDPLGVECHLGYEGYPAPGTIDFLKQHLRMTAND